jgi:hypothetical protein
MRREADVNLTGMTCWHETDCRQLASGLGGISRASFEAPSKTPYPRLSEPVLLKSCFLTLRVEPRRNAHLKNA